MSSVEVSALAQTDLLNIYLYGAEAYGRDVALRYAASLQEAFSLIAKFRRWVEWCEALSPYTAVMSTAFTSSFTKNARKASQSSALFIARN